MEIARLFPCIAVVQASNLMLIAENLDKINCKAYIVKGSKNVFHKNKSRCRDGAKCLQRIHVPAWKNQLAEKLQEQGGVPFHAQQSRLTFSGIKDTLDTCSPSLHLATSVIVYMHML